MTIKTKENLKKEISDVKSSIEQITKRRNALQTEHDTIKANVKKQTQLIGEARLDGRDTEKEAAVLARDRQKLEELNEALNQADDRLKKLNTQQADADRKLVKIDFDQVADGISVSFLGCLDKLYESVAVLDALKEKFEELDRVGAPAGFQVEHDDNLRLMKQMCGYLHGDYSAADGIRNKLIRIEDGYPNILSDVRKKMGR